MAVRGGDSLGRGRAVTTRDIQVAGVLRGLEEREACLNQAEPWFRNYLRAVHPSNGNTRTIFHKSLCIHYQL
jgi:hypothetical protein